MYCIVASKKKLTTEVMAKYDLEKTEFGGCFWILSF
jgi:hypothetical protein